MRPRKIKEVAAGLVVKGFKQEERDHSYFFLFVGGKKTSVRTKISHGSSEISTNLLSIMARQLFLNTNEFADLIDCPLSFEDYIKYLVKEGRIRVN